jgi:RNA polymerase sigma factor (sigma-70 family)
LKGKNIDSFNYLYDNYHPIIYGTILRIVSKEEIASEILQDVFLKIWDKASSYDKNKGKLFTWMINMARYAAIDKLRSKELKKEEKTEQVQDYVTNSVADTQTNFSVDHIGVTSLLDRLDKDHKLIFDLVYYKGYTHSEISKEFDIPLGTVKTRIRNGLKVLRKHLDLI